MRWGGEICPNTILNNDLDSPLKFLDNKVSVGIFVGDKDIPRTFTLPALNPCSYALILYSLGGHNNDGSGPYMFFIKCSYNLQTVSVNSIPETTPFTITAKVDGETLTVNTSHPYIYGIAFPLREHG